MKICIPLCFSVFVLVGESKAFIDPLSLGVASNLLGKIAGGINTLTKEVNPVPETVKQPEEEKPSEVLLKALEKIEEEERRGNILGGDGEAMATLQNSLAEKKRRDFSDPGETLAYEVLWRAHYKSKDAQTLLEEALTQR